MDEAGSVAEQLRLMVENLEFVYKAERIPVTISLGVTDFRPGDTPDDIIGRADAALYKAKEQGRNQVVMAP
jgi:diguanylate cyclase (GGDEF)-like protein